MPRPISWLLPLCGLAMSCRSDLCEDFGELPTDQEIITIGDSILAWGTPSCSSVSHQLGFVRNHFVQVEAVSNTQLTRGIDRISEQYFGSQWDWVVLDGGANDLNKQCRCSDSCDVFMDILSSRDGRQGTMVELVETILLSQTQIVITGYYPMPEDAWYDFQYCGEHLSELNLRYARIASRYPKVYFLPLAPVMNWEQEPELLDFDRVHPSADGSEKIATYISEFLRAVDN